MKRIMLSFQWTPDRKGGDGKGVRKKADLAQRQMKNHCGRFDQKRERRSEEKGGRGELRLSRQIKPFSSLSSPFALSLPRLFFPFFPFFSSPVAWPLSSLIVGVRTQFEIRPNVERKIFPRYFPVKILFTLFQTVCGVRRGYSHQVFFSPLACNREFIRHGKGRGEEEKRGRRWKKGGRPCSPHGSDGTEGKGWGGGEEGALPLSALFFSAGGCARKGGRGSLFFLAQLIPIPRPIPAWEESFGKRKWKLVHVSAYTSICEEKIGYRVQFRRKAD